MFLIITLCFLCQLFSSAVRLLWPTRLLYTVRISLCLPKNMKCRKKALEMPVMRPSPPALNRLNTPSWTKSSLRLPLQTTVETHGRRRITHGTFTVPMNEMLYTNKPAVTVLLLYAKSNRYQWNGEPWKAHKHTHAHMHT